MEKEQNINFSKFVRKNNSKRMRSLIFFGAFTAVILIAEVYAWFSTQQNVSINNLQGRVQVAEGLQISLDAKSWRQSITFGSISSDEDGLNGVNPSWSEYDTGIGNITVNSTVVQSQNIRPKTENTLESGFMNPVSTTEIIGNGNKVVTMFTGDIEGSKLSSVRKVNANEIIDSNVNDTVNALCSEGYYAFDVYLISTTNTNVAEEQLQLNSDSIVQEILGNAENDYGLKNSVRVGFALYEETADVNDSQEEIIAKTYNSGISQVAIWEPNSDTHSEYAKSNNQKMNEIITSGNTTTYAINEISENAVVENVYSTTDTTLAEQKTMQTPSTNTKIVNMTDTNSNAFNVSANKVSKMRIYVWLEGQDVDCVNWASHSSGINVNIGLTKGEETVSTLTDLEKFILGENGEGRPLTEIADVQTYTFKNIETESINDANSSVIFKNEYYMQNSYYGYALIEYDSNIYKFKVNPQTYQTIGEYGVVKVGEKITATSILTPEVGSIISYDKRKWIVMYISDGEIEMISKDALIYNDGDDDDELDLGSTDAICSSLTSGTDAFTEADLNGDGVIIDIEKSIYSYNHAITTINNACVSLINDTSKIATDENGLKIRSVGSNPTNPSSENATPFTSTFLKNNPQNNATYEAGYFDEKGKSTDTNFVTDYDRLVQLGANIANKEGTTDADQYWLASRFVNEFSDEVDFGIRRVGVDGYCYYYALWYVSGSFAYGSRDVRLVRPVVSLKSGLEFEYDEEGGYFTIK